MFRKIKDKYHQVCNKLYDMLKIPHDWTILRKFDFNRAEEFYQKYKYDLDEMSLCMGFDENVWEPVVEDGVLINPPCCFTNVSGVEETVIDVPCISYRFKSDSSGKFECSYVFIYSPKYNQIRALNMWDIILNTKKFRPFNPDNYPGLENIKNEISNI